MINCNLGPISHRFRDMATFRLKSLPRGQYSRLRSSKVIDLGLNGKPIGDFLLVIIVTLALSRTVSEIWPAIGSKSQNLPTPLSFRALDWGDPYGIFGKALQILNRGVARIFGLGGRPCRVEPDPASTEVAKPMRGVWVLPQNNFADPNAWNAFSQHLAPSP